MRLLTTRVGALLAAAVGLVIAAPASTVDGARLKSTDQATLFLSPSGSDSAACTAQAPCKSFNRAYHLAKPGQVVQLAAGDYGGQSLTYDASKRNAGSYVVFRPAQGASVKASGELSMRTDASKPFAWVEFDNIAFGDYYVAYSQHVVFRNDSTAFFFLRSVNDVKILGGQVGPNGGDSTSPTIGNYSGTAPSSYVTIDGVNFTGLTRSQTGEHIECLFVQESDHLTVRNSHFSNCDIMSIYLSAINGGQISNALIENNSIAAPTDHAKSAPYDCSGCVGFYIHADETPNLTVRYNSLAGSTHFDTSNGVAAGISSLANVGYLSSWGCASGITYQHNVWTGVKCGDTDIKAPSGFVNSGAFDLHLVRGAAAIGRGDPTAAPRTDIDGQLRPRRMAPDAGADQREPASIALGRSIGAVKLGMQRRDVIAFYGGPRRLARHRTGSTFTQIAYYRVRAGQLLVTYFNDTVVGVGTTSAYYQTPQGLGPGESSSPRILRLAWDACQHAYRARSRSANIYYQLAGGKRNGDTITMISMLKRGYKTGSC